MILEIPPEGMKQLIADKVLPEDGYSLYVAHVYHVGERDEHGRWKVLGASVFNPKKQWNRITRVDIHPGLCKKDAPDTPCKSPILYTGESKSSTKDRFDRFAGVTKAIKRAVEPMPRMLKGMLLNLFFNNYRKQRERSVQRAKVQ